ncbi:MAG: phosphatidylglycerol lysyltransferase [Alkalispirochaetaceae bacterium]
MSSHAERYRFLDSMVVSSSGWRGVFGAEENCGDHEVSEEKREVAAAAIYAIAETLAPESGDAEILLATDTRPTSPALADVAVSVFSCLGLTTRFLGVSPTPEVLAYATALPRCAGFIIITASHNPVGHNGIKFGFGDGRVAGAAAAGAAAQRFRRLLSSDGAFAPVAGALEFEDEVAAVRAKRELYKGEAREAYRARVIETMLRSPLEERGERVLRQIQEAVKEEPLGIVIDFNGSARTESIDISFLEALGIRVEAINATPGQIAHQIVPEGEGLEACKAALSEAHRKDPAFQLGYTADNDGDRGNLVFINPDTREAEELHAQEVFALAAVAELSWYEGYRGDALPPALVVNGPTSLRVDEIAATWGAELFRAEVGEANVVDRGGQLRGYQLVILGEGSNGGNITPPSQVRDPLSTVGAMIKLARSDAYYRWFEKRSLPMPEERQLMRLVRSLPGYTTTGAYEPRALLSITSEEHGRLKAAYEALLPDAFERLKTLLPDSLGIEGYRIVNYEGTRSSEGPGNRRGDERGGFKVELLDKAARPRGFVWMRGSKTENAFRIMADIASSDRDLEAMLLDWHADLVRRADSRASGHGIR